ncbi:D-alanine--D-alanine ligase family protein [Salirhabdus salicampi]|uniref:D-alanine--D-alanine ligase family protein n=1 Tax=Salirhabdus salicampi TaxID=476102 RepID=UPI0020C50A95|nr:D-alanine--D-alanine ligase [Salirhabdus salicampi]MCP8616724.1 D-alanine--D-alanine ligase [Salirhabdus salicampi]
MKIAVLYGGVSGEREVSLSTGTGMMNALKAKGHEVIGIDFHPNHITEITKLDVDLVFIGLHGKYGEDGKVQSVLDMANIPYVGSGVLASALAMDKSKAKQIFDYNGIPTAKSRTYAKYENDGTLREQVLQHFTPPFVIKPNQEGSTLGLTIVQNEDDIGKAIAEGFQHDDEIIVEDYVKGREVTVAVWGEKGKEEALPIIEIIPKNDYYDYESKYKVGGSEHIVPAKLDDDIAATIQKYAVLAHQLMGCETYSRVDFIVTEENIPFILEVNTLPGMTPTSLFPDAAKAVGISYEDMIEKFIHISLQQ